MDKQFWNSIYFYEKYRPKITCPTCGTGLLTIAKNDIKYHQTKESSDEYSEVGDIDLIVFRFSAILTCNNPNCKDIVASSGRGGVEPDYSDSEETGSYENVAYLVPEYFVPALNIIPIKKEYPSEIKELLTESFSIFFCDNASCANKIRQIIERVLDLKKIKRKMKLHNRIILFKSKFSKYSEIADNFLAIKFIGNIGSHSNKIKRNQLLHAYEILQHSLDKIYIDDHGRISRLAKRIIKKKGRVN